jgi:hypothetical protein
MATAIDMYCAIRNQPEPVTTNAQASPSSLQASLDLPAVQHEPITLPSLVLPNLRLGRRAAIPDRSPLLDGSDASDDLFNDGSTINAPLSQFSLPCGTSSETRRLARDTTRQSWEASERSPSTNVGSGNYDTGPAGTPERSNSPIPQVNPVMLSCRSVRLRDAAEGFSSRRKRRECDTGSNDKPTLKPKKRSARSRPDDDNDIELEELRFDDFSKCDQGHIFRPGGAMFIFDGCKNVWLACIHLCVLSNASRCAAKHASAPAVALLARFAAISIGRVGPKPSISSRWTTTHLPVKRVTR